MYGYHYVAAAKIFYSNLLGTMEQCETTSNKSCEIKHQLVEPFKIMLLLFGEHEEMSLFSCFVPKEFHWTSCYLNKNIGRRLIESLNNSGHRKCLCFAAYFERFGSMNIYCVLVSLINVKTFF